MYTYKQSSTNSTGAAATLVVTPTNPLTLGSLVTVSLKFLGTGTSPTVTDNASTPNTYTKAIGPINNATSGYNCYQFYGVQITGGATTITVNWTNSDAMRATADEFGGAPPALTNATILDSTGSGTGTGTSGTTTAFVPNRNDDLIVAAIAFTGATAITAGAKYTIASNQTNQTTFYRIAGSLSETAPITWTTSDSWVDIACAYYATYVPVNRSLRPHPFSPGLAR